MMKEWGLDDVLNFGKHRGRTIEHVCRTDPTYLEWCLDNINDFFLSDEAMEVLSVEADWLEDLHPQCKCALWEED